MSNVMMTDLTGGEGIRVLVVEDIRLHRENLVASLANEHCIADADGTAGGDEALGRLGQHSFGVVLLSLASAVSWAVCRGLVAAANPARVIAYAVSGRDDEVVACAAAGISGYVLYDEPQAELMKAVVAVAHGDIWCPPRVAAALMRRMGPGVTTPDMLAGTGRLTVREREILALIDDGLSNKEIARKLSIEVRTVKNHVHNLLEKLRVHRRGEAVALLRSHPYAIRV